LEQSNIIVRIATSSSTSYTQIPVSQPRWNHLYSKRWNRNCKAVRWLYVLLKKLKKAKQYCTYNRQCMGRVLLYWSMGTWRGFVQTAQPYCSPPLFRKKTGIAKNIKKNLYLIPGKISRKAKIFCRWSLQTGLLQWWKLTVTLVMNRLHILSYRMMKKLWQAVKAKVNGHTKSAKKNCMWALAMLYDPADFIMNREETAADLGGTFKTVREIYAPETKYGPP